MNLRFFIYKSVFLPRIMYASEIWFPLILRKVTYRRILCSLQRSVLMVTGAYKTTDSNKLLNLIGELNVEDEMILKEALITVKKEGRRSLKDKMKELYLENMSNFEFKAINLLDCSAKYTIWCISKNGPFACPICGEKHCLQLHTNLEHRECCFRHEPV